MPGITLGSGHMVAIIEPLEVHGLVLAGRWILENKEIHSMMPRSEKFCKQK